MNETKERDRMASRIKELCVEIEGADEAYRDADTAGEDELAEIIRTANLARFEEVRRLVADLSDYKIRNRRDIERRTDVLLSYCKLEWPEDSLHRCPVVKSLEGLLRYARKGASESSLLAAALPSVTPFVV